MTAKTIVTPVGKVGFYALDRPATQSQKFSLTITLDLDSEEAKEFKKQVGSNASVIEKVVNGKPVLQIGASTKFDSFLVSDAEGNKIEAPTNVRTNQGDVMMAKMVVSPYSYDFKGKSGAALNLLGVGIISHDTTGRVETEATGNIAELLGAIKTTETKLKELKG